MFTPIPENHTIASISLKPIGYLRTCFPEKFGVPKQGPLCPQSLGSIYFLPHIDMTAMTSGLELFSHLWIIWIFHQNKNKSMLKKIHPPRLEGKKIGVFSTRSPHRPNPLGITVVELVGIEKDHLLIRGLDMTDHTPVLDIKPYIPQWDSFSHASSGWLDQRPEKSLSVQFSDQAQKQINNYYLISNISQHLTLSQLFQAIESCLKTDPRPFGYKKLDEKGQNHLHPIYAFRIYEMDVHFCWTNKGFQVTAAEVIDL